MSLKDSWLDEDFEKEVDRIIDADLYDLSKFDDNYRLAHPIVAAILERVAERCIYGFSEESIPWAKKAKNKAKRML